MLEAVTGRVPFGPRTSAPDAGGAPVVGGHRWSSSPFARELVPDAAPATLAFTQLRTFVRFVIVGGGNTVVTFAVFHALQPTLAGTPGGTAVAQAAGYAVGTVLSFLLNRRWTFGATGRGRAQLARFVVTQLAALAISALAIQVAVSSGRLTPTVAWVVVTAAITVLNFAVMRTWVFGRGSSDVGRADLHRGRAAP